MRSHAEDLRAEVQERQDGEQLVEALLTDPEAAPLTPAERGMVEFAVKLTRQPEAMERADVDRLREIGWDDVEVHHIVQITGLFGYYNRLADGLGIDPEPDW